MRYDEVMGLRSWDFVRLVGVSVEVYQIMVEAVEQQSRPFGRPPKLALRDQVLLCLMYWREYRTLAAIGFSYGVSETTAWRIVRRVENALLASGRFTLPGKKALHSPQLKNALVLLDATDDLSPKEWSVKMRGKHEQTPIPNYCQRRWLPS